MNNDYITNHALIQHQPSSLLLPRIMKRIAIEKQRQTLRKKMFIFSTLFCLSFLLIIPILQTFISEASSSGFVEYWQLIFYDASILSTYWSEWSYSVLESLPALSLAGLLLAMVVIIFSLKNILVQAKNFYKINHLIIN